MKLTRPIVSAALALLVTAVGWLAWNSLAAKEQAPEVSYTLLNGSNGSMSELKGKVLLVNFWATSCVTCVAEMPQIVATHQKFKSRGYETLAVAMSYDPPAYVARFAETRQLPFGVAIDNTGEIARRFGDVKLTPTSYLINQRGEIVKRYVGAPDFAALHVLVDELLKQG
jgi:peroxiredoxin